MTDPQQLWDAIAQALKDDLPKASFETWVWDVKALTVVGATLILSARNAYARDWLQSRLHDEITSLVSAFSEGEVTRVAFEVAALEEEEEEEDTESAAEVEEEASGKPGAGKFNADVITPDYERIVRPGQVVGFSGYALRLLDQGDLTPKEMSLWIGFRQAVYKQWSLGRGNTRNIPYRDVIRFAMMSRASFFREISGKETLAGGMVEIVPDEDGLSNRYRVHMSPRLTRRDAAAIEVLLREAIQGAQDADEAKQNLVNALAALRAVPDIEVGSLPASAPRTVAAIAQRVLGSLPPEVVTASERAQEKILTAYGAVIVPHYFFRSVAPALQLTHPQAWLVILLRDRCWFDYETRIQQEYALVSLQEAAAWVGVTVKSLKNWLQTPGFSALAQHFKNDIYEGFVVRLEEPVVDENPGAALADSRGQLEKVRLGLEEMRLGAGKSETPFGKSETPLGKSETRFGKNETLSGKSETRFGKSETPLNLLTPTQTPKTSQIPTQPRSGGRQNSPASGATGGGWGVSAPSGWDMGRLCETLDVNPRTRPRLQGVPAERLVAWLMRGVVSRGVTDPVGFALSRVLSPADSGEAGKEFDALANAPPERLLGAIRAVLHPYRPGAEAADLEIYAAYKDAMGISMARASALWKLLTGQDACDGVSVSIVERVEYAENSAGLPV